MKCRFRFVVCLSSLSFDFAHSRLLLPHHRTLSLKPSPSPNSPSPPPSPSSPQKPPLCTPSWVTLIPSSLPMVDWQVLKRERRISRRMKSSLLPVRRVLLPTGSRLSSSFASLSRSSKVRLKLVRSLCRLDTDNVFSLAIRLRRRWILHLRQEPRQLSRVGRRDDLVGCCSWSNREGRSASSGLEGQVKRRRLVVGWYRVEVLMCCKTVFLTLRHFANENIESDKRRG